MQPWPPVAASAGSFPDSAAAAVLCPSDGSSDAALAGPAGLTAAQAELSVSRKRSSTEQQ